MIAFDVGGVDFAAAVWHVNILIVVCALFDWERGLPELVFVVEMEFGFRQDAPVGELPEDVNIAVGKGERALEGEVRIDVVFGKGVAHIGVLVDAGAVEGVAAFVGAERAGVILQHIGLVLVMREGESYDAVAVGAQRANVEGAELRAAVKGVAAVVIVETVLAGEAGTVGEPRDGIVPPVILLDGGVQGHNGVAHYVRTGVDDEVDLLVGELLGHVGGGMHVGGDAGLAVLANHKAAREDGLVGRVVIYEK